MVPSVPINHSRLDVDFEDYVQTKIALTRDPLLSDFHLPTCNKEGEAKETIAFLMQETRLFQRCNNRVYQPVLHFVCSCAISYVRSALLQDYLSFEREARETLQAFGVSYYQAVDMKDRPSISESFVRSYEALLNTLYAGGFMRKDATHAFLRAIAQDLIAAACHPSRYIQCLDTEDAKDFSQITSS